MLQMIMMRLCAACTKLCLDLNHVHNAHLVSHLHMMHFGH